MVSGFNKDLQAPPAPDPVGRAVLVELSPTGRVESVGPAPRGGAAEPGAGAAEPRAGAAPVGSVGAIEPDAG